MRSFWSAKCTASEESLSQHNAIFNVPLLYWIDYRWKGSVESLRRKYLELDTKRQSELGKKLTIKAVAIWIHDHHNPEELEFETIRDHLSKARKGIFTND